MKELRERERSIVFVGNGSLLSANNKLYLDEKYKQVFTDDVFASISLYPSQYTFNSGKLLISFFNQAPTNQIKIVFLYRDDGGINDDTYKKMLTFVKAIYNDIKQSITIIGFNYKSDNDITYENDNEIDSFFNKTVLDALKMKSVSVVFEELYPKYTLHLSIQKAKRISNQDHVLLYDINFEYNSQSMDTDVFDNSHENKRREKINEKIKVLQY